MHRAGTRSTQFLCKGIRYKSSLMYDPLSPRHIAKSQSKSLFPKPALVSLDLWDTVFHLKAPIDQQYHEISHGEFDLDKLRESIKEDFGVVFREMNHEYPNYGKQSETIKSSDDWWIELIRRVYKMNKEDPLFEKLQQRLMTHFSGKEAYELYDDVLPFLEIMREHHVPVVVASNSDYRLVSILESLGVKKYFPDDNINISYEIGLAKPSRDFFNFISNKFYRKQKNTTRMTKTQFLENSWHIGDDYEKDFVASVRSGWNGVLLDRRKSSVFFAHERKQEITNDCFESNVCDAESSDLVMVADNRVCVSQLVELTRLFDWDH